MRVRNILAAATLLAYPAVAPASTITESITAHVAQTSGTAPVSFDLSYQLTFDPTRSYTDATAGLTLVRASSVNGTAYLPTFAVPTGFTYVPGTVLEIGGLLLGVGGGNFGTDDYELQIEFMPVQTGLHTFQPAPYIQELVVASATPGLNGISYLFGVPPGFDQSVGITQIAPPVATPEPSTLALLTTALAAGMTSRRKKPAA